MQIAFVILGSFSHSYEQLRDRPNLTKTKLCPDCEEGGECRDVGTCPYAHDLSELRATPMLFRTVICSWWKKGQCEFGDSCRFAHGEEQLRESTSMSSPSSKSVVSPLVETPSYPDPQYSSIFAATLAAATAAASQNGISVLSPQQMIAIVAAASAAATQAMNHHQYRANNYEGTGAPAESSLREELNRMKKGFASSPDMMSFFGEEWNNDEPRPRAESDNLIEELRKLWVDQPVVQGVPLMRSDPFLSASHMTLDSYQINND